MLTRRLKARFFSISPPKRGLYYSKAMPTRMFRWGKPLRFCTHVCFFSHSLHPCVQRVKEIIDSGELGKIKSIHAELCLPKGIIPKNDIREDYQLGGGATMDLGSKSISTCPALAVAYAPGNSLCY